jgi:RNA polymerase sigma-70 factor (ECF subfamily)
VNLAYRFCRDRSRAEDLAQEAFVRAYRGLRHWRREAAFSTWLLAVATNHYRSELRRIPAAEIPLDRIAEPRAGARASEDLAASDRDRVVRRAVDSLPARYREAVLLFYFMDMNIAAAAQSLQGPEGTVKARLSRARDLLRRKLPRDAAMPRLTEG